MHGLSCEVTLKNSPDPLSRLQRWQCTPAISCERQSRFITTLAAVIAFYIPWRQYAARFCNEMRSTTMSSSGSAMNISRRWDDNFHVNRYYSALRRRRLISQ